MTDFLDREPLDLDAPGVPSLFDELSFWSSQFGAFLFRHYPLERDLKVLDVGCANGFPLFELAHSLGPGATLVGVDPWGEALRRAAFKKKLYDLPNVSVVHGDGAALPFQHGAFHRVVSNLGINNFDDPEAVLREAHRVLSPGGLVTITSNVTGHMVELYEVLETILRERGDAAAIERLGRNVGHRLSGPSIAEMFANAGFTSIRVIEDAFTMRYLDGSALLRHSLVRIGFLDGWRTVAGPQHEREILGELEKRLNNVAAIHGNLRMTVPMVYVEGRKE